MIDWQVDFQDKYVATYTVSVRRSNDPLQAETRTEPEILSWKDLDI